MTKEQERAELHRVIWQIANDLRGSVDGWDFKSYVLGILFYRFISENITAYINKLQKESGIADYDLPKKLMKTPKQPENTPFLPKVFSFCPVNCFKMYRRKPKIIPILMKH